MSKRLKPVRQVCGTCYWAKDDSSSVNGLLYVLCSKKENYLSSNHDDCCEFKFSKQAKEMQERFERQELQFSEDKRILAKSW
jgi:hypothetical protein